MTELEKYNNIMKHFQDVYEEAKENQSMSGYKTHVPKYFDDDNSGDYEGSMIFRHWLEDDDSDDYDGSLVFRHWNE